MYIEAAIYYHLINDADVAALVGTRIYPNVIPQDASLPSLAYQVISRPGLMAHDGPSGLAWPRVQFTVQADDYDQVVDLTNKVRIALDGYSGLMGGPGGVTVEGAFVKDARDGHQFATERETRRLDAVVYHKELEYYNKILEVAPNDLVGYWPLWELTGSVADNLEGTATKDGSYTGVQLGQEGIGEGNYCPFFDGANDYVNVYSAQLNTDFDGDEGTALIWGKVNGSGVWTDGTERYKIVFRADADNYIAIAKPTTNNRLRFIRRATTSKLIDLDSYSNVDWYCAVLTWSQVADELKAYIDGAQIGSTQTGLIGFVGSLELDKCTIGAGVTTPSAVWHGNLAHVAIWRSPLTAAQIRSLFIL